MPDVTPEATPERAACDAFWAAIGAGPSGEQPPDAAWNWAHEANAWHAWEAAAQAANRVSLARVLAECARYKAERDAAREERAGLRELFTHAEADRAEARRLYFQVVGERERYRQALERIRDLEGTLNDADAIARAALAGEAP